MKNLGLGLVFGASAGLVLSLFSDKNGKRLGKNLKENIDDTVSDAKDLKNSIRKAKDAGHRLAEDMPEAKRAVSDIADDFHKYNEHSQYLRADIKHQAEKVVNKD